MFEVEIGTQPLRRFASVVEAARLRRAEETAGALRTRLAGRTVWNVNSTAVGGGVAEMLRALLPYVRGAGCDVRWLVLEGDARFFRVTKRLHHALHGSRGDGSSLGADARRVYDEEMGRNAPQLAARVRPRDVVVLHDPQTAGLAPDALAAGALVLWRSHIGREVSNKQVERGWAFLERSLRDVPSLVFSRRAYVPPAWAPRATVITPSIDVFSPKNQELDEATVRAILVHAGIVEGPPDATVPAFVAADGAPRRVRHQADLVRLGRAPTWDAPLVVQVSRWDPLKDHLGVLQGFASLVQNGWHGPAQLVLAGPNVHAVADDPEGARVFDEVLAAWRQLPHDVRSRVHLISLPMTDVDENAAIVNALQRHAAVVAQKSLHEGFGLTVTEAMWKRRPVVASAVGGIVEQIEDGRHGLLLRDPQDLDGFAALLRRILDDPARAAVLGTQARARVQERFLALDHLERHAHLIERLDGGARAPRTAVRREGS